MQGLRFLLGETGKPPLIQGIRIGGNKRGQIRIEAEEIARFKQLYVTLSELGASANISSLAALKILRQKEVIPIESKEVMGALVFRRDDVSSMFS